jgi:transposase InsO family protein
MLRLLRLLFGLVIRCFRSRRDLVLENLAPRQQLSVLKRKHSRPWLAASDRLFLVVMQRLWAEFVYLAVLLDGYSRKVVGWKLDRTLASRLAIEALERVIELRRPPAGLVHHSDRGVQYASAEYVTILKQHGMVPSMSRPANPYDNASCESFIKTLKREEIYADEYQDLKHLRDHIEEFIERYYNQKLLHSALGYRTPEEFEAETCGKSEVDLYSATLRFFTADPQKVTTALVGEGTQTPPLPHAPTRLGESMR